MSEIWAAGRGQNHEGLTGHPAKMAAPGLAEPDHDSPQALLRHGQEQANDAGSFRVGDSLDQTALFEVKGSVAIPDRARLSP